MNQRCRLKLSETVVDILALPDVSPAGLALRRTYTQNTNRDDRTPVELFWCFYIEGFSKVAQIL
jgi:hypothetical protein